MDDFATVTAWIEHECHHCGRLMGTRIQKTPQDKDARIRCRECGRITYFRLTDSQEVVV